ncbi:MAG: TonB-dependent receptor [Pseudomonadota bacterium]
MDKRLNLQVANERERRRPSARLLGLSSASFAVMATLIAGAEAQELIPDADQREGADEIVVIGDPIGLLEDEPTESVFGFGRSSLETPRSISVISEETIQRYSIEDIDDFITTTPGTFGGSFFGVPGSITIRGAISETYFRGFKRSLNNGTFPTPVGSAERIEIVRGAVPVIYGAGRIGGYLNLQPKAAQGASVEDGMSGSLRVTGGSFEKFNVAGELLVPFEVDGKEGGIAFYAELEDSGSFYKGRSPESELIQLDYNQELGSGFSVQVGGMYLQSRGYFQTPGYNRLTQELIDDGTYVTGRDTDIQDTNGDGQLNPNEITDVVGTFFGSSNIRTFVDFGVFGFPDAYALDEGVGETTITRRDVFLAPDFEVADSESLTLYADLVKDFDDSGVAKLQFFYDSIDGDLNVSYGFAEQQRADIFEVRGSYTNEFQITDDLTVDIHTTASHRRTDTRLRQQFLSGFLVLDRRDLSVGPTATDIFATPITDPTIPWDSNFISDWTDTGVSLITDVQFFDFSVIAGGRFDHYKVDASDSGVTTFGAPTDADASEGDFSYSISGSYRSPFGIVPYITYAEGSEPTLNANGGISPGPVAADQFLFDSELFEVGLKFQLLDKRLNGSIAYYDQTRTLIDPFQNLNEENSEGVEVEVRYLITDNFTFTGAATFQEFNIGAVGECGSGNGEFVVIPPTHPTVNAFGQTITGAQGYGGLFAALNASCLPELQNGYERTVIPDQVFSSFVTYTSDEVLNGLVFGGTFGATYVSETGGKTVSAVTLPDYFNVRAALFASYGRVSITGTLENALNARYFQPVQGVYEEVAALPGQSRLGRIIAEISF